jgi:hypothetical protein
VAQLAAPEQAKIDADLDRAQRAWEQLPDIEAAFAAWPEDVVLDFVFEWTLEEDRLHRLATHDQDGELTAPQQRRYQQLVGIVRQHRPTVERLIAS